MKKQYLILIIVFSLLIEFSNSQTWQWSKQIGGTSMETFSKIYNDDSGNAYVVGGYSSDTCYIVPDTLFSEFVPQGGFFIVKYNSSGILQWVVGNDGTTPNHIAGAPLATV